MKVSHNHVAQQPIAVGCCLLMFLTQAASAAIAAVEGQILETAVSDGGTRCMVRVDAPLPAEVDCDGDWLAFDCGAGGSSRLSGEPMVASTRLALTTGKLAELLVADGSADGVCRALRIKVQDETDEELDEDGDGVSNLADDLPLDSSSSADLDGDGHGDEVDLDDDGDGIPDADDPAPRLRNHPPLAIGSLADRTVFANPNRTDLVDDLRLAPLQALFSDPDGDPLALTMESAAPSVATAALRYLSDDDGPFYAFRIVGEVAGVATFTLTATDPSGSSASLNFRVVVKPVLRTYRNYVCASTRSNGTASLGFRCGTKICGNEGEGEMGVVKVDRRDPHTGLHLSGAERFCSFYEGACVTKGGLRSDQGFLSFDYAFSSEGAVGHVQVCPRRGGKEFGLSSYRMGSGALRGRDYDPSVYCGTSTSPASEVIVDRFRFRDTYDPEMHAGELLDMLQLPATTTVSFSCDGFPDTVSVISRRMPIQYLTVGNSVTVDLDGVFEASEWMPLAIYPEVRDEAVARVELVATTTLRIYPLAEGETEVLLNAVNEYGSTVSTFSISVGRYVDIFWEHRPGYYRGWGGVFYIDSVPEGDPFESLCGTYSCGHVEGYDYVEPSSDGTCPLYEKLTPAWGSVRFRYESSEDSETGERRLKVCPFPASYPKNPPGWYSYLVNSEGVSVACHTQDREHARRRFLFEGNGFRIVNDPRDPSLGHGIRFDGPLGYANSMMDGGLRVSTQLGLDELHLDADVCRAEDHVWQGTNASRGAGIHGL